MSIQLKDIKPFISLSDQWIFISGFPLFLVVISALKITFIITESQII